ncbi:MAG: hypothetical protein MUE94_10120, partial [Verrucomicrobia bacterium]|nr:hypothetical protein [Verrucomicrobiota bacterium]
LLAEMAGSVGQEHYGEERWESEAERAEGIVGSELRKAGWKEEKLGSTAKGHQVKVRMALRLRAETTVSYGWIAERLRMGSRSNASNLVYAKRNVKSENTFSFAGSAAAVRAGDGQGDGLGVSSFHVRNVRASSRPWRVPSARRGQGSSLIRT